MDNLHVQKVIESIAAASEDEGTINMQKNEDGYLFSQYTKPMEKNSIYVCYDDGISGKGIDFSVTENKKVVLGDFAKSFPGLYYGKILFTATLSCEIRNGPKKLNLKINHVRVYEQIEEEKGSPDLKNFV